MSDKKLKHKHLLVNATFQNTPFVCVDFTESWIKMLVKKIGMEILYAPKAVICDKEYNEGISAFCLITTSHISLHSWEKSNPNLVQLDVYSCKNFDQSVILNELNKFNPLFLGCKFLDREIENTKGWRMFGEDLA